MAILDQVIHIGNDPTGPGGISSVIRRHLARDIGVVGRNEDNWISYVPGSTRFKQLAVYGRVVAQMFLSASLSRSIVHIHLARGGSLLREGSLILLARIRGAPRVIVTVHGSSAASSGRIARFIYRVVLSPAHVVHLLSDTHRKLLSRSDSRIVVLPNDVVYPVSVNMVSNRERLVIFLGEISYRKGIDTLISAWQSLNFEEWRLELYGEHSIDSTSLLAELPSGCAYKGYLKPEAVSEILQRATMLVLPSRAEAFPMALCEAMAAGCVVVATAVGGVPGILNGPRRSQLILPDREPALAGAISCILSDDAYMQSLSDSNRLRAAEFSPDVLSTAWRQVYDF